MDGLQVADTSQEKQAVVGHSDKFPQAQTYAYPPSTTNSQPLAPDYQQPPPARQYPVSEEKPLPPDGRYRIPFGLSIIAYTILVAAIILAICGAGFGGALGVVAASKGKTCLASDNANANAGADSALATTTATTTTIVTITASSGTSPSSATATNTAVSGLVSNYTPSPGQISTAALDCTNGSSLYSSSGSQFQLNCNTNYPGNDLDLLVAYTLDDCIGACSNMNTEQGNTACMGVLFNANMAQLFADGGGNCFLKSAMQNAAAEGLPPSVGAILVSAAS